VTAKKLSPGLIAAVTGAIVLVMAVGGWFLLISPKRGEASHLDTEIAQAQADAASAQQAVDAANKIKPVAVPDLFKLAKAMPDDVDMAGVLLELNRVASESGIAFESITPGQPTKLTGYRVIPTDVVFEGNFYSLADFLYRLRNLVSVEGGRLNASGRLFAIDKLSFGEADAGFPQIKAAITIDAFVYGDGPTVPVSTLATTTTAATTTSTTTTESTTAAPSTEAAAP
jgi:hypothetical protein